MDDMEQLSYEESKRQTKERRDKGKNMIRPFTFDEEKILRDGLFNNGYKRKIFERNPNTGVIRWRYTDESPDKFGWPHYGRILKEKKNARSNNRRSKKTR